MNFRFLLLFAAVAGAAAQTAPKTPPAPIVRSSAPPALAATQLARLDPVIRFEDATDAAGINFTHSFGSRQLGSLLEGTGAGCVWIDYRSEEHTSELQSLRHLVCRLLLEK